MSERRLTYKGCIGRECGLREESTNQAPDKVALTRASASREEDKVDWTGVSMEPKAQPEDADRGTRGCFVSTSWFSVD